MFSAGVGNRRGVMMKAIRESRESVQQLVKQKLHYRKNKEAYVDPCPREASSRRQTGTRRVAEEPAVKEERPKEGG